MINVTKTYLPPFDKYADYIKKIFNTGIVTNNGEMVTRLEKRLQKYLGVKNIVLVQSGTLALQIAYKILNIKEEIITTPFSFVATTSSLLWEGLRPIFVDIDKDSFNIDINLIEKNITERTSAIVPVHVFGNSCDIDSIYKLAKRKHLKVIYDAAHAFGIKYKDKSILSYGDVSILSFHATKVFHTIEGGALAINDDKLYERAVLARNFGIKSEEIIKGIGINAKMNEFEAAMGLCVLDDIDEIIKSRKRVYENYVNYIKGNVKFQLHNRNSTLNYSYMPIVFESEKLLKKVLKALLNEGVKPRRYFYPCLANLDYVETSRMCIAEDISKRILCLPMYDSLKSAEQIKIIDTINKVIKLG
ncbi:DegT/DnrJ/EryC1/StrS family aminotransferase [Clostridium felsineum]|uniref:dTDP-4-amino-4,6-dideoxy-D-glucose transaminase n=1 Tax=Clostridium felsineum TaxID=36839 RepID=A0A1S8M8T3_9CLOT|nr:DegT/DnrJ/EryC1/StrS family aminotransferase [Clostridium felsineum]URZ07230.1 dTDP-4-amino-4,6-dideoxy-D-glucose transaminase [Clostridium felsineum]URZ12259.1 dTDP-4-amino-4,6-dideoxy-D-glucose transaminase [Clostridium felsineum]